MANYANLEAAIVAAVYENANNEITGAALQSVLLQMVSSMGKSGMLCNGVADGSTTPPVNPDSNIFYIAPTGTYPNFGGLVVADGEWAIFIYNGGWQKQSVPVVDVVDNLTTNDSTKALSAAMGKQIGDNISQLAQKVDELAGETGIAVGYSLVANEYVSASDGSFLSYNGWSRTDYIDISAYSSIKIEGTATGYNYFYAADKSPVSNLNLVLTGSTLDLSNYPTAKYIALSDSSANMANLSITVLGYRGDTIVSLGTRVSALETDSNNFSSLPQDGLAFVKRIKSVGESGYITIPFDIPIVLPKGMALKLKVSGVTVNSGTIAAYFKDDNNQYYSANSTGADIERTFTFNDDKTIVEYGINKNAPSVIFSAEVFFAAGYIADLDGVETDVETIKGKVSPEYTTIVATRNAADYNSIREIIANITDATPSHKYIVFVPVGRWFECDIQGKENVSIVGEDRERTILYCDGTSSNLTPAGYSYPAVGSGVALSSVNQQYKHCIFAKSDIDISNLTIEVNDAKYCVHLDNPNWSTVVIKNCHLTAKANTNYTVGVGINGGQKIDIQNTVIERTTSEGGVFLHNWNNQSAPSNINIDKCYFKGCDFGTIDELGSEQDDEWLITNCYSSKATPSIRWMVDHDGDGNTYWVNPETGERESNPQAVPYCIKLNTLGSNVKSVEKAEFNGTSIIARPNCLDYMISNFDLIQ